MHSVPTRSLPHRFGDSAPVESSGGGQATISGGSAKPQSQVFDVVRFVQGSIVHFLQPTGGDGVKHDV